MLNVSNNQRIRDAEQGFNEQGPELNWCFFLSLVDLQFRCKICHDILPLEINNTFFRNIHLCKINFIYTLKLKILISGYFRP